MKKISFLTTAVFCLVSFSSMKMVAQYPVIDVASSAGKYQRVYCSDLFSSIELIPLETGDDCLIAGYNFRIMCNDSIIVFNDRIATLTSFSQGTTITNTYAFDRSGKFINNIGRKGPGPGEYATMLDVFINTDKPTVYISDFTKILEYDFSGKFIRSFPRPTLDGRSLTDYNYAGDGLFVGNIGHGRNYRFTYCLFNQDGDTVKTFPSRIFFGESSVRYSGGLPVFRVDNRVYLKDYINDTLYVLSKSNLQPAYVFSFGKNSTSKEAFIATRDFSLIDNLLMIRKLMGMPNYFFYQINVPARFSRPKSKPEYNPTYSDEYINTDNLVYGLYDIARKTNILLDTDRHLQKGIVNDLNGGLPFIPLYYAGNNTVVGVWDVTEMQEMLTEDYFAKQTVKDPQAHQKLKEILKNLKYDDNPVIVIAKLK